MCGVFYIGKNYLQKFLQLFSAKCQPSSGVEECHYCYVAVINIGCIRGMSLANVIAASFTSAHAEDHYPRYTDGDCTGSVDDHLKTVPQKVLVGWNEEEDSLLPCH
jgi:hypothetical protein